MALTKVSNSMHTGAVVSVFDFMTAAQIADVESHTGSIDVSSALQAAIDACATSDRTEGIPATPVTNQVFFPAGTYLINTPLTVSSYLNLRGAGRHTTFIKSGITDGTSMIAIQYTTPGLSINYNVVSDMTLDGQSNDCGGLFVGYANRFKMSNVQIMQCGRKGLWLYGGVINMLSDVAVWGCGDATYPAVHLYGTAPDFGPNATTFIGGEVYASGGVGVHVEECVNANFFGVTMQANAENAVLITNGKKIKIDGCYFEGNKDDVKVLNGVSCTITNNLFTLPDAAYTAFIVINRMTNCEIYGNEFQVGKNAIGATTEIGSLLFDQCHVGNNFGTNPLPIDAGILALANNNGTVIERWDGTIYGYAQYGRNLFMSRTYHDDDIYMLTAGDRLFWNDTGAFWRTGTVNPEGVITAPVGSLFTNTNGSTSTTLYVKETGTGNTGWVAK